jgi:predicted transcriptional regulator
MADVTTFTFQVDKELEAAFSDAAAANDMSGADILRDFMRDYVEQENHAEAYDAWFRRKVQTAINAANAGHVISDEAIEDQFAMLRENARKSSTR